MKIIAIISLCFFFFCLFSKRFTVKFNDMDTDNLLARICAAFLVAAIMFVVLTIIFSPILLIYALVH